MDFDPELKVSVSAGTAKATEIATSTTTAGKNATGKTAGTYTSTAAPAAVTLAEAKAGNKYTVTMGGKSYEVTFAAGDNAAALKNKWVTAFNADAANTGFTAAIAGDNVTVTKAGGAGATDATLRPLV